MEKIIHESVQGDYDGESMVDRRALGGNWRMRGRGVTKPVRSRDAARRKRKAARKARSRR